MSGYDIFRKALELAGISGADGSVSDEAPILKRALTALHHVCIDLKMSPVNDLSQMISASEEKLDACMWGVAMLLASGEGDTAMANVCAAIYNGRRSAVLSGLVHIKDVLPVDNGGTLL